ncbi:MAG: nucleotidyltransferase domain-containing protein [Planctomycetes bacterium]|nr:nucleotidyltransferase domain-containing protein [Planctomycetota bacterium]
MQDRTLPPILSAGTTVVLRLPLTPVGGGERVQAGSVGTIVRAPLDATHTYRVRLVDGGEVTVKRDGIEVLRHFHAPGAEDVAADAAARSVPETMLRDHVIYRCVIGSRAYGLDREGSDVDRRGCYLPPADVQWSLFGVPEQIEDHRTQECYWELGKLVLLALKANPNVLEVLWTPLVEHSSPVAEELLGIRSAFLSKLVYVTYNGYVLSQFRKIETDLRLHKTVKPKHAMHLIRLLLSGITAMREGHVPVRVEEHRDRLLAIRDGEMPWPEVNEWRRSLHREFDAAFAATALPERPDYEAADRFLVGARRSMVR